MAVMRTLWSARRMMVLSVAVAALLAFFAARSARAADEPVPDTTPPSGVIHVNSDAKATASPRVVISIAASDDLSGVARVELSNDGTTWADVSVGSSADWTLRVDAKGVPFQGTQTVRARFTDNAGNRSEPTSDAILVDTVGPTATAREVSWDPNAKRLRMHFDAADPSGLGKILIACNNTTGPQIPFAADVSLTLDASLTPTCTGYHFALSFHVSDSLLNSTRIPWGVSIEPAFAIEVPQPAVTGRPFTIRPIHPPGLEPTPGTICRTEFRWGNSKALFNGQTDNTFGGILFEGPASEGFCGEWRFTLPWVPFPQYDYHMDAGYGAGFRKTFKATVGGTSPHLGPSNLPLVYVLKSSQDAIVGQPMTFTLYRLNGAGAGATGRWVGNLVEPGGTTGAGVAFHKTGGSTFTFTPNRAGYWLGGWDAGPGYPTVLSGYYDPPVRAAPVKPATPAAASTAVPPTEIPPTVATLPSSGSEVAPTGLLAAATSTPTDRAPEPRLPVSGFASEAPPGRATEPSRESAHAVRPAALAFLVSLVLVATCALVAGLAAQARRGR
jgi:hypothetical protein